MSTITPFPGPLRSKDTSQEDFEREVTARFGLLPNFFRSTPDAPYLPMNKLVRRSPVWKP